MACVAEGADIVASRPWRLLHRQESAIQHSLRVWLEQANRGNDYSTVIYLTKVYLDSYCADLYGRYRFVAL